MEDSMRTLFPRAVILANDQAFEGTAGLSSDEATLLVTLDDPPTLAEVFADFNDPEKTSTIVSTVQSNVNLTDIRNTFIGYTWLTDIRYLGKKIMVHMKKPVNTDENT